MSTKRGGTKSCLLGEEEYKPSLLTEDENKPCLLTEKEINHVY